MLDSGYEPTSPNPKLESVEKWLNRSFDRDNVKNHQTVRTQPLSQICRQQSEDSEKNTSVSDELVEINFNAHTKNTQVPKQTKNCASNGLLMAPQSMSSYLSSSKSSNNSTTTLVASNSRELINGNRNVSSETTNRIDGRPSPEVEDRSLLSPADPSIKHISLYKNPKDSIDGLGIKIAAKQHLSDLGNDLATVVKAIIPNGLVQLFELPIRIGDEIVEINGVSLRNKTIDEIVGIFSQICELNNGEIELILRTTKNSDRSTVDFDEQNSLGSSIDHFSSSLISSSLASSPVFSDMFPVNSKKPPNVSKSTTSSKDRHKMTKDVAIARSPSKSANEQNTKPPKLPLLKVKQPESMIPSYDENIFTSGVDEKVSNNKKPSRSHSRSHSPSGSLPLKTEPVHQDQDVKQTRPYQAVDVNTQKLHEDVKTLKKLKSTDADTGNSNKLCLQTQLREKEQKFSTDSPDADTENMSNYFQSASRQGGVDEPATNTYSSLNSKETSPVKDVDLIMVDQINNEKTLKKKFQFSSSKKNTSVDRRRDSIPSSSEMPHGSIEVKKNLFKLMQRLLLKFSSL